MTAYYNEIDEYAAQWLRNLISAGHIAPGDVDTRSIEDVRPDDLRGYTQCHFFAGIGVWSHALRRSGWSDDRPVWTGSCPCQPFSAAGKGGGFDDERHLWPAFQWLIEQCQPAIVFGEQVASKDGLGWLDLVSTDLEALGYACGAVPFPAAGIGAPHIRQRLYWGADADRAGQRGKPGARVQRAEVHDLDGRGERGRLANAAEPGRSAQPKRDGGANWRTAPEPGRLCDARILANTNMPISEQSARPGARPDEAQGRWAFRQSDGRGDVAAGRAAARAPDSFWSSCDWIYCRDGKWRPVEPGTFPLAHGATSRVGRLRAYGNAIVAEQAQAFIESYLSIDRRDVFVSTMSKDMKSVEEMFA